MNKIVEWYKQKTDSILEKYGPGPIVHFHTGFFNPDVRPQMSLEPLRLQLVESQRLLLDIACSFWGLSHHHNVVLDFGCGLGGSAIHIAQHYGSNVYALTNVPSHLVYIERFAEEAGVGDLVKPILGGRRIPGEQPFDAVIAIESSCYLNRSKWFEAISRRLTKRGVVCIADSFTSDAGVKAPFDDYWLTNIGSLEEYRKAASSSGLKINAIRDITDSTSFFWELSTIHSKLALKGDRLSESKRIRITKSIEWQSRLLDFWRSHRIRCLLLKLSREDVLRLS